MAVASMRAVHFVSTFGASLEASFGSSSVFGESLRCNGSNAGAPVRLQQKTVLLQPVSAVLAAQFGC